MPVLKPKRSNKHTKRQPRQLPAAVPTDGDEWSDGELVSSCPVSEEDSDFEVVEVDTLTHSSSVHASDDASSSSSSPAGWPTMVLAAGLGVIGTLASIHVGKVMSNAVSAGANEAHQQFIRSDPLNPATFFPTTYIGPFLRGALSMGVATAVKQCKGVEEGVDLQTTINRADAWVQEAKRLAADRSGGLSMEQEKLAELWIEEARQLLARYIETHSKELNKLLGVSEKIAASAVATATTSSSVDLPATSATSPLPSAHQAVTVGTMLELAHRSVDAQNPTKDGLMMSKSDKRLLQLIEALEAMPRVVPIHMHRYTPEEVDARIEACEAMGSRLFIESMQGRVRTLAQNLWAAPSDQIKRVIVLASAPGAGKCWGKNTKLMLFNGRSKKVQDIKAGDRLMGDDGTPRTVQAGSVRRGHTSNDASAPAQLMPIKTGHEAGGLRRGKINGSYECKYDGCSKIFSKSSNRNSHEGIANLHTIMAAAPAATYRVTSVNEGRNSWTCNGDHILVLKWNCTPGAVYCEDRSRQPSFNFSIYEHRAASNTVVHACRSFATRSEAEDAQAQAVRDWEPLIWEGSVNQFLSFSPDVQRRAQMYAPARVQFQHSGKSLRLVVGEAMGLDGPASQEVAELVAWAIGVWLTDGVAGRAWISQIKDNCNLNVAGEDVSHAPVVEQLKLCYEVITGRPAGVDDTAEGIVHFDKRSSAGNAVFSRVLQHYKCFRKKKLPHHLLAEDEGIRMKLLAGVVDGDGYADHERRQIEVAAKKRSFLDGVIHLARGLGFSTGKVGTKHIVNKETGQVYEGYRVSIGGTHLHHLRVALLYKRIPPHTDSERPNKDQRCDGFRITKVAHASYYGFTLDGNGRCLMDDFVVTHNTTTMEQAAMQWIDWPFLKFKGSDLAGLKLEKKSTAFHVFCKMLAAKIATARDSRGQLTKCMLCYIDDMDRMLDDDGIFAQDPESRKRLFLLFKDFGDALITAFQAQEPELFSYALAEGMLMPFDMRHVHMAASVNKMPSEWLPGSGDQASRQRLACITVRYADEFDRRYIGTHHYMRRVAMGIRAAWSRNQNLFAADASADCKEERVDEFMRTHIDEDLLEDVLLRVVQKDIEMFAGTFQRQLGIRGLRELLDQVESKILTLLPRDPAQMDSKAVFLGAIENLDALVQSIESYNGRKDERMAEVELKKKLLLQLSAEHAKLQELPEANAEPILKLVKKCEAQTDSTAQQTLLDAIRCRIAMWTNRVELPAADVAGQRLRDTFGYFAVPTTANANVTTTAMVVDSAASDVDRFTPICTIFESVYWRMRAARLGKMLRNDPVVVNCVDGGMPLVTSMIHGLAKVMGGVPVHTINVHSAAQLVDRVDLYTVDAKDPRIAEIPCGSGVMVSHPQLSEAFSMVVAWNDAFGRKLLVLTYSSYHLVIPNAMLDEAVKHCKSRATGLPDILQLGNEPLVQLFHQHTKSVNRANAMEHVQKTYKQRITLLDGVFCAGADPTASTQRSLYESFVIVPVSKSTLALIDAWRDDTRTDLQGKDAFMRVLGEKLNNDTWALNDERTIDPRMLTMFLVDNTAVALSDTPGQRPALRWVMGNPPIQGRETQARQYLEAKLIEAHAAQSEMRQLLQGGAGAGAGAQIAVASSMVLDEMQLRAFEQLVQFDMDQARKARSSWSCVLSPTPLMSSIDDLITRVQNACSPFGFQAKFPDVEQLRAMWVATYHTEMSQLEQDWKRQRAAEQERMERERAAEEQRKLEEQARNVAKQNIAYREAESDHYSAKYRNNNNRSVTATKAKDKSEAQTTPEEGDSGSSGAALGSLFD